MAALCALPVVATGIAAIIALQDTPVPLAVFIAISCAAIVNGTAEELFWRRAILPNPGPCRKRGRGGVVHRMASVSVDGSRDHDHRRRGALLAGAAMLGAIWMATMLRTGTVGTGVLSHTAVDSFAFTELVARNLG